MFTTDQTTRSIEIFLNKEDLIRALKAYYPGNEIIQTLPVNNPDVNWHFTDTRTTVPTLVLSYSGKAGILKIK